MSNSKITGIICTAFVMLRQHCLSAETAWGQTELRITGQQDRRILKEASDSEGVMRRVERSYRQGNRWIEYRISHKGRKYSIKFPANAQQPSAEELEANSATGIDNSAVTDFYHRIFRAVVRIRSKEDEEVPIRSRNAKVEEVRRAIKRAVSDVGRKMQAARRVE
jgi:hypothetical protein